MALLFLPPVTVVGVGLHLEAMTPERSGSAMPLLLSLSRAAPPPICATPNVATEC